MMYLFGNVKEFDWDEGNIDKNAVKHDVEWYECEQIFFNRPLFFLEDKRHSITEKRYYAYGATDAGRLLTTVFTVRKNKIRIISARDMTDKEQNYYEKRERS